MSRIMFSTHFQKGVGSHSTLCFTCYEIAIQNILMNNFFLVALYVTDVAPYNFLKNRFSGMILK